MRYTWDENKNIHNIKRHKIAFDDAVRIFEGQTVEQVDDRFEYGEVRVYAISTPIGTTTNGALFQRGRQNPMNEEPTGKMLDSERKTDWERLRSMSDADVHVALLSDNDAVPTDENFWKSAVVVMPSKKAKEVVTMRIDHDVLEWFRQERGYQTRINAILVAYMKVHDQKHQKSSPR
ncbi:conserved hypothetical protein [Gammaproteobacteria bacterium]